MCLLLVFSSISSSFSFCPPIFCSFLCSYSFPPAPPPPHSPFLPLHMFPSFCFLSYWSSPSSCFSFSFLFLLSLTSLCTSVVFFLLLHPLLFLFVSDYSVLLFFSSIPYSSLISFVILLHISCSLVFSSSTFSFLISFFSSPFLFPPSPLRLLIIISRKLISSFFFFSSRKKKSVGSLGTEMWMCVCECKWVCLRQGEKSRRVIEQKGEPWNCPWFSPLFSPCLTLL